MRSKDPGKKKEIIRIVNRYYSDFYRSPSAREIAKKISLGKSAVYNYLAEMRDEGTIDYDGKMILTANIKERIAGITPAGLIGSVPCGSMPLEEQSVEEYVDLPARFFGTGKLFILQAKDDSMTDAGIKSGDLLVIDSSREPRNGDIVLTYIEGEGSTLKRLRKEEDKGWIVLHPENEKDPDIVVKDGQIQGVVQQIIKNV